jgi:hypothetical protein
MRNRRPKPKGDSGESPPFSQDGAPKSQATA